MSPQVKHQKDELLCVVVPSGNAHMCYCISFVIHREILRLLRSNDGWFLLLLILFYFFAFLISFC